MNHLDPPIKSLQVKPLDIRVTRRTTGLDVQLIDGLLLQGRLNGTVALRKQSDSDTVLGHVGVVMVSIHDGVSHETIVLLRVAQVADVEGLAAVPAEGLVHPGPGLTGGSSGDSGTDLAGLGKVPAKMHGATLVHRGSSELQAIRRPVFAGVVDPFGLLSDGHGPSKLVRVGAVEEENCRIGVDWVSTRSARDQLVAAAERCSESPSLDVVWVLRAGEVLSCPGSVGDASDEGE